MAKRDLRDDREAAQEFTPLNREQKRIRDRLKRLRFKKRLIGGVSERDVWKKLEELNNMYNAALNAERVRYDALLEQERRGANTDLEDGGGDRL